MIKDEAHIGTVWQIRDALDRRFWFTSGVREAIGYGVVDDFGTITRTPARPFDALVN